MKASMTEAIQHYSGSSSQGDNIRKGKEWHNSGKTGSRAITTGTHLGPEETMPNNCNNVISGCQGFFFSEL